MQQKIKKPPALTRPESEKLDRYIWMSDWQFDSTIKSSCIEIASYLINQKEENNAWEKAIVFGLQGIWIHSKEPCIANIFIRYGCQVFQTTSLSAVVELIDLLKKEAELDKYENEMLEALQKERQKTVVVKTKK